MTVGCIQITQAIDVEQQQADRPVEASTPVQLARTGFGQVRQRKQLGQAVLATLSPHVGQVEHSMDQP